MADEINWSSDQINMEDICERFEELRDERQGLVDALEDEDESAEDRAKAKESLETFDSDYGDELATLQSAMDELRGSGGDHKFEGDWYPGELIADSHFEDYAQQLAEDIGAVDSSASWPNNCIDWEKAASELQQDYSSTTIAGNDFWYR